MSPTSTYAQIYAVVRDIPEGRVATYGQVAALAGLDGRARQVGYALHALPEGNNVPWHRVVNAHGKVSLGTRPGPGDLQKFLLEAEGVTFDQSGRITLKEYRWEPEEPFAG
jgi:methylated-DNA-protein-cysteine methyltransferase-like protein